MFARLASLTGVEGTFDVVIESDAPWEGECRPAVPLVAALGAEKVFCLVCGWVRKMLKRHLSASHGLTPGCYGERFGVPAGTPLVAGTCSTMRPAWARERDLSETLAEARRAKSRRPGA
ncbi:MAG: MucR family transcriptional regulator [Deltaproteobacteria bacterium]|nr:MucR family transcriptional regulator [Deltaproteobacteria bacterium]